MDQKLSISERTELLRRHKIESDKRICDRIKAVLAYDDGYNYSEIARLLLLDDETIRRYVQNYFAAKKLSPNNGGSSSLLTVSETEELLNHLRTKTYRYVKLICHYVLVTFGKSYTVSGMTKWLHAHRFRYKKPHGVPAKAELAQQEAFMMRYAELKASLGENDVIYFADSCHPQHQTRLAYGWIEKGTRKAVKMTACQKRINIIGAINLKTHQVEYQKVDWVNADSIKTFLRQLQTANPHSENIHLIWDNAGYHKSKEIRAFIENTNINLHFLPPYSPNLNPIERLWKIMHEEVTYNRYFEKFKHFTEGIISFLDDLPNKIHKLQTRITDNFQRLCHTNFAV
jgi:transposase